jgi:hypothetical protein
MAPSTQAARHLDDALPSPTLQAVATGAIELTEVNSAKERKAFLEFPFKLYQGDSNWVPPLMMEREQFLNPKKNPWFEFGSVQLYLARRNGELVGRIAAVEDPHYNEFHGTRMGWFGMFEAIDDVEVARALFDKASAWVKAKGQTQMLGPANFSSSYEIAALQEGFDSPPSVMMTYNPRYYLRLFEACGFSKAKDLWAYSFDCGKPMPEKIVKVSEMVRKRQGLVVRPVNLKDWDNELKKLKEIYDSAWEKNWGFYPMTPREFVHSCTEMKLILKPELILIAESHGEPAAFAMTLPNLNEAFQAANGHLFSYGLPIGAVKFFSALRRIRTGRLFALGIKEKFRKRGIDAVLYHDTLTNARKLGYTGGEISWTLEDNDLINNAIQMMGGERSKTYRVWQRPVS